MARQHRWPKKPGRCLNMCGMNKAIARKHGGSCRIPRKCIENDKWGREGQHCWHGLSCCICGAIAPHKAQRNGYGVCVQCGGKIHPDMPSATEAGGQA